MQASGFQWEACEGRCTISLWTPRFYHEKIASITRKSSSYDVTTQFLLVTRPICTGLSARIFARETSHIILSYCRISPLLSDLFFFENDDHHVDQKLATGGRASSHHYRQHRPSVLHVLAEAAVFDQGFLDNYDLDVEGW